MSNAYAWPIILSLMCLIIAMRCSFFLLPRKYVPKGALAEALTFAPLAALAAVCAPEVLKGISTRFPFASWTQTSVADGLAHLKGDWRLWGGVAMVVVVAATRQSKSASLYGLIVAALIVFSLG